jgi:hypothetical protein
VAAPEVVTDPFVADAVAVAEAVFLGDNAFAVVVVVTAVVALPPGGGKGVVGKAAPPDVKVKPEDSKASAWSFLAFERCHSPDERSSRRSSRS